MSTELARQVQSGVPGTSMMGVNGTPKSDGDASDDGTAAGPFGVLRFQSNTSQPDPSMTAKSPAMVSGAVSSSIMPLDPPSDLSFDPMLVPDYSLQWTDLFELDFDNFMGSGLDSGGMGNTFTFPQPISPTQTAIFNSSIHPVTSPAPTDLLQEAPALLRNFQDHVIPSMAGLPFGSKSPWRILNVASAVQTLAELTYLGQSNIQHAKLANIFGLLAASAFHLASNPSSPSMQSPEHWMELFEAARSKAKSHLQHSLRFEISGPTKAKYKEQLMAILSLTASCVVSGNHKDARCWMVDAERLVRMRGLAKRDISRKARMLHHVYTWVRIIGESTYVLHDYSAQANAVNAIQSPSNLPGCLKYEPTQPSRNARLDDFLRLEDDTTEVQIDEQKDAEAGLADIHLDDARNYPATMYLQIYGLPETWLSLLSQTTRLANAMDSLKTGGGATASTVHDSLQRRAKRLEDMVCSFTSTPPDSDNSKPTFHMLRALNSALLIFFYRRVRDVNSWILQGHVDDVIKALGDFDAGLAQTGTRGPGTAWPAFIAGCEAMSGEKRTPLLDWVDKAYFSTGLNGYKSASEMMQEVWRHKDRPQPSSRSKSVATHSSGTWMAASREKQTWIMLC